MLPGWEVLGPLPSEHLYKHTTRVTEPTEKEYQVILPRLLERWRVDRRAALRSLAQEARAFYTWGGGGGGGEGEGDVSVLSQKQAQI